MWKLALTRTPNQWCGASRHCLASRRNSPSNLAALVSSNMPRSCLCLEALNLKSCVLRSQLIQQIIKKCMQSVLWSATVPVPLVGCIGLYLQVGAVSCLLRDIGALSPVLYWVNRPVWHPTPMWVLHFYFILWSLKNLGPERVNWV